jgi:hypothetical protein
VNFVENVIAEGKLDPAASSMITDSSLPVTFFGNIISHASSDMEIPLFPSSRQVGDAMLAILALL